MQAYEGYFENGQFYTSGRKIRIPERKRIFLTILEEPPSQLSNKNEDLKRRAEWLKKLNAAIQLSLDEELPYIPRSTTMREPVDLSDEG